MAVNELARAGVKVTAIAASARAARTPPTSLGHE